MSIGKRTFFFVTLALLVWSVLASLIAGYYYYQYNDLFSKTHKPIIHVNLGINYGNGTTKWFNETKARAGDTFLDVTMLVATVNYTSTPGVGAWINSINNVANTLTKYWYWWLWTAFGWAEGQAAADRYIVGDNETYYWYYEAYYFEAGKVKPTPP